MAGMTSAARKTDKILTPPPSEPPLFPPPVDVYHRSVFVDREKTCPLLLRVFTKVGSHHRRVDFAAKGKVPKGELQIYTWRDATLREITDLVREQIPEARRKDAWMSFAFVFPGRDGNFLVKRVGKTFSYGYRHVDDDKALAQLGFQNGDYLDVAIFLAGSLQSN